MGIARFGVDRTGELIEGVFYEIYWDECWKEDNWRSHMDIGPKHIISEPRQLTWDRSLVVAEEIHIEERDEYKCDVSRTHRTNCLIESMEVDLRGNLLGDFVPNTYQWTTVTGACAKSISQSGLKGFTFVDVAIRQTETPFPADKQGLRLLQSPTNNPLRLDTIWPSEANTCYLCGYEPLCCLKCGYCIRDCPRCEGGIFATASEHQGEGDRRILIERGSDAGLIVEVNRWDGSDLVGVAQHHFVTKRAVDFLLANDVWPFEASPVRANIKGISKEKMAMIERAKRPIEGGGKGKQWYIYPDRTE